MEVEKLGDVGTLMLNGNVANIYGVAELTLEQKRNIDGGFAPPTQEQMDFLSPWEKHFVCW
ncbi:MAG: hypothetical protein LBN24_04970 [Mediterranea sp.]|jgi:hypothetical protein|nr:hypothetical protein [Mediterranea sp.]